MQLAKHIFLNLFEFFFAVKQMENLIEKGRKGELQKSGLVQNRKEKMRAIHCMPDHTHLFVGFKPTIFISDFVKEIKVESNEFSKDKKLVKGKFAWQEGWGVSLFAFTY